MSGGLGGSPWGGGPWGGSLFDVGAPVPSIIDVVVGDSLTINDLGASYNTPLRVDNAVAVNPLAVRVIFSNELDLSFPALLNVANYTIPGLTVTDVSILNAFEVLLTTEPSQLDIVYTVTVGDAVSINGDSLGVDDSANFRGYVQTTSFIAGAESSTKVELIFSTAMTVNAALTTPSSYTIQATDGGHLIPVISAFVSGSTPYQRVVLVLGEALLSKQFYAVTVGSTVFSLLGLNVTPPTYILQWADMTQPVLIAPLEIPIKDFSGEVRGGLLGQPDGQVFFSPAFSTVSAQSTIELEELSVCTKAYDEYLLPVDPDPEPLRTFSPNGGTSLLGISTVLWAPAARLGRAVMVLGRHETDACQQAADGPSYATLVETINTNRAAFLNDPRWKTYPNTSALVFRTADNQTSIGPGPTTNKTLDWPKIEVRDDLAIGDTVQT